MVKQSKLTQFNEWLAIMITQWFGSMTMFYACLIWCLIPIYDKALENTVFYVSGGIIQLVALPLIMVGTNILSRSAEKRAQIDHITIMKEFSLVKHMVEEVREINLDGDKILLRLDSIETKIDKLRK
jgi:hypothetical protein